MQYKISKYTVSVDRDDGIVLFNTLSGAMLYLYDLSYVTLVKSMLESESNLESVYAKSDLFERLLNARILVDKETDEMQLAKLSYLYRFKNNNALKLLLYVTDDCNFKCVYCPQNHVPNYMKKETLNVVIESVEKLLNTGGYDSLIVSWFGGEPLLNLDIIELGMQTFLKLAKKHGINIYAGITTNGYLLTNKVIERLFSVKVLEYQITLDGDKHIHDKNRHLKNGEGTWDTIWNNLIYMKEFTDDFSVNLRINVNMDNLSYMPDFIIKIKQSFDQRYAVRIQPIVDMGNPNNLEYAHFCSLLESQIIQLNLYDFMANFNIENSAIEKAIQPFGLMCACSDANNYVIRTDGRICKCELKINEESNNFGNVYSNGLSLEGLKLADYIVPSSNEECSSCKLYPLCMGLTCPYKRSMGMPCTLKNTFLLEEYIATIANKLIKANK